MMRFQRALEGEIALTIQTIQNVNSARVLLALPVQLCLYASVKNPALRWWSNFIRAVRWKKIHHFYDPKIGMVQTRWTHLNRDSSASSHRWRRSCSTATSSSNTAPAPAAASSSTSMAPPACGAARAISDAGGWQHDTLTEDTDLSYRSQLAGWKFKYLPDVECPAELPIEMTAFKTQQARWAKGLIQTSKKILPQVIAATCPGA